MCKGQLVSLRIMGALYVQVDAKMHSHYHSALKMLHSVCHGFGNVNSSCSVLVVRSLCMCMMHPMILYCNGNHTMYWSNNTFLYATVI